MCRRVSGLLLIKFAFVLDDMIDAITGCLLYRMRELFQAIKQSQVCATTVVGLALAKCTPEF